jgi:hypothetical protein
MDMNTVERDSVFDPQTANRLNRLVEVAQPFTTGQKLISVRVVLFAIPARAEPDVSGDAVCTRPGTSR